MLIASGPGLLVGIVAALLLLGLLLLLVHRDRTYRTNVSQPWRISAPDFLSSTVFREELMDRNIFSAGASLVVAVICAFAVPLQVRAQDPKTPYPSMAPVDQYLMPDHDAEIALARSAAPDAISRDATILVLGRHCYETAVKGKNGFVCVVERGWMGPFDGEFAVNFWNPKLRGPVCFNPPAARSILPMTYKRTEMVLAGQSKAQIIEGIKTFINRAGGISKPPPLAAAHILGDRSKHAPGVWVQTGVQLARFRRPISGLNGAESTVSVKFNSRMLYR